MEFKEFPKIARLFRSVTVSEKIDGTNAQVAISEPVALTTEVDAAKAVDIRVVGDVKYIIHAGSRNRWVTPDADNYGFAAWVKANAAELLALGPGQHFGEWWGQGIQRKYGLAEKRFSLFNVGRWHDVHGTNPPTISKRWDAKRQELSVSSDPAPACCYVVPVLATLDYFCTAEIEHVLSELRANGSKAAPGFMQPEGIVAFHSASGALFKVTVEKDAEPKGKTA